MILRSRFRDVDLLGLCNCDPARNEEQDSRAHEPPMNRSEHVVRFLYWAGVRIIIAGPSGTVNELPSRLSPVV